MYTPDDTIAAIATPLGVGGISVLRVSGEDSLSICDRSFRGKRTLKESPTHTAHFGTFISPNGEEIDEVVATVFLAPQSYTGETVVEISCHGGIYVTKTILEELVRGGARMAEPGEFTKRAFLNGKIDLSQAEAVSDLISSRTKRAHLASMQQLSGRISHKIQELREMVLNISSLVELELDFSEEGIDLIPNDELLTRIDALRKTISSMIESYEHGRLLRTGIKVVLTGQPNVGKSSILNHLLDYQRAIVSEVPGTTRDTLEESLSINGMMFNLTDTAGLRESGDRLEELGIERARREIENAEIILFITDKSKGMTTEEEALLEGLRSEAEKKQASVLLIENKIDLLPAYESRKEMDVRNGKRLTVIGVSAITGQGIDGLRSQLTRMVETEMKSSDDDAVTVTNERHHACLAKAMNSLDDARSLAGRKSNTELIAENLNQAAKALGEIIGTVTSEDVLNNIFSRFCIGK